MAVDTPATIAILGAGPIGLEAALYARFLGYDVCVYERGAVAEHVLGWGHVRMFTPFSMNCSPLGLAALTAQDDGYRPPEPSAPLLGREWVRRYLEPLSQTDLLADHIHRRVTAVSVSRHGLLKGDRRQDPARADAPFRVLGRADDGTERSERADIVIDTTGVFANPNWLGPGGTPALGEVELRGRIEYGLPDIEGRDREQYAGRHTLLVGAGYSAATSAVALRSLALQSPGTRVTWTTQGPEEEAAAGPIREFRADPLSSRRELAAAANRYAAGEGGVVTHWPGTIVEAVCWNADQFVVRLSGRHAGEVQCDRIIANVGFRPDDTLYAELQVDQCGATGGPQNVAAFLRDKDPADCLASVAWEPSTLRTAEPNFYVLGAKSFGRDSRFTFVMGLAQIRALFALIGDRADLDLYKTVRL
jgi:thioredoxin reductase